MRYTVLFDACVLYPAPLRDFLIRLAITGLFSAKWTDQIHDEWIRNLLKNREDLRPEMLQRTRELMNRAVPDCLVTGYEFLIDGFELPDPDDRHVLAAAVRCKAQAIITFNQRDFPASTLEQLDLETLDPDRFVENQFDLKQGVVIATAKAHRASLKNPPKHPEEYLETLAAQGLVITADRIREFIQLI